MNNLTTEERKSLVDQIVYWICDEEKNKGQVLKLISKVNPEVSHDDKLDLIREAFDLISALHNKENSPLEIIKDHIEKYEKIYSYFKKINYADGMNKAMQAKERLLNITNDANRLVVKKSETIIHKDRIDPVYDINKLPLEKQKRLRELLEKIKVSDE